MRELIFTPNVGIDWWTLFHILMGIVVGFGVQHTNYNKVQELHQRFTDDLIEKVEPHIKKLPEKFRERIDLKAATQPLRKSFDIHTVLMVAFFWEILEMYMEMGEIYPGFTDLMPGQEHRVNRLILDPLMLVLGYRIARSFPKLFWPAVIGICVLFTFLVIV